MSYNSFTTMQASEAPSASKGTAAVALLAVSAGACFGLALSFSGAASSVDTSSLFAPVAVQSRPLSSMQAVASLRAPPLRAVQQEMVGAPARPQTTDAYYTAGQAAAPQPTILSNPLSAILLAIPAFVAMVAYAFGRQHQQLSEQRAWQMLTVASEVSEEDAVKRGNFFTSLLANLKLAIGEIKLKMYQKKNPDSPLYFLPQRNIIKSDVDVLTIATKFPEKYRALFTGWYSMYKAQAMSGGATEQDVHNVFNRIVDRLILLNKQPYTFESAHKLLTEPYNYFEFGQEYTRLLVDYDRSYLRNIEKWDDIAQAIQRGENVILLGNHQSESDAAFIPLLLEVYNKKLGEQCIYVAGDRVVSDPMVQPFSMGRNLFCVHSKKHMDDDPRMSRKEKQKMNRKTLLEMSKAFKVGGNLVWMAPAGGRDRRNAAGEWAPADFDIDAVELMRSLGVRCGKPTHIYPFAMATNAIMPPPETRAAGELGEKRITNFTGVALSLGAPYSPDGEGWLPEGMELGSEEARQVLSDKVFEVVNKEYDLIKYVMKGFGDGTYVVPNGSQPWKTGEKSPYQI